MIQICDHKLLIFQLLLIMSVLASETTEILTFTGYEGGKVEIWCPYDSGYKEENKYLCRGECKIHNKDIPVESGSPAKDERFSLTDDRMTHIFTVTITDLRTEDKGQYWCAVRTGILQLDDYTEIILEIKPVFRMFAVTGQHLNISCHYKSDLKNKIKFICKESDRSLCETNIKVSSETNRNGRFSLRDDKSAGVFTVTITDLTLEDSGKYWCGARERGLKNKIKWISVTHLNINNLASEITSSKPTTTASVQTSNPATEDRPVTSVFPLSATSTSPSVSFTSSSSNHTFNNAVSSQPESGFIMFVMLVVIGILTGCGFSLFMYFKCRQKKEAINLVTHTAQKPRDVVQGPAEQLPNRDVKPDREVTAVSDYEEICNTLDNPVYSSVFPVFDEHNTVYALAQLPSSDNLNYSTVKFSSSPGHM